MTRDYEFPEGKVIKTLNGGTDALKRILLDLKKYAFSGYVKTISTREDEPSIGYVVVKEGTPAISIHSGAKGTEYGRMGLKRIWEDSYDRECQIDLHARVDVDEIVGHFGPKASIAKMKKAEKIKIVDKAERVLRRKLESWEKRGFDVSKLEKALKGDIEKAREVFRTYEEDVKKLKILEEILDSMETEGFEDEVEAIKAKFRNPEMNLAIEADIERLREKIEEKKDMEQWLTAEEKVIGEKEVEVRASAVADMLVETADESAKLPPVPSLSKEEIESGHERDEKTNLISQFTFDRFVVGPSNRFAQAACLAVAKTPYKAYNPLFICSGPGLGKTHLLNAIGNHIMQKSPETRVLYVTTETFINEFNDASKSGDLSAFRRKYRSLDVMLLDDAQFLSGKDSVQEELFHTFNALYNENKEIALTSDRPPKDIPELENRLVSRFESGLVADIQPPELETKIAILAKKAEEAGVVLGEDVLHFIANAPTDNIRELEGLLNRVVAYSSLTEVPVTLEMAREVLSDIARREDLREEEVVEEIERELVGGRSYLIEEDRPANVFRLCREAMEEGNSAFLVTRTNPKRMRDMFDLGDARIVWLTDRDSATEETIPPTLERIIYVIENFIRSTDKGVVALDGLEYLISNNNFDAVLRFLRRLIDEVSESSSFFLLSVSPKTLKEQELKILEREMEVRIFR
ncbi:MAG: chromosomal replication initiator protein DnaA [Thermoplasmata archaeon]